MLGNKLPLYVLHAPSGRYCYVGSIPTALGKEVPATKAAVFGCRSHRSATGELVMWKFPTFDTQEEAVAFAAERGFEAKV